ncbi:MAG: hypothetical protein DRJ98_06000 [Thermoprotei archaeon]|nr:MAG: hypothetical protein DRJ98_06000 [Thermoprotei archaeon]RLF15643.1 MAG: hypothetical protein DRN06_05785 [Thermoprotei archaeon]
MYADPSKLTEEMEKKSIDELRRTTRRIFNLATLGFRQTLGNDQALNWIFLRVLVETNKLRNELSKLTRES